MKKVIFILCVISFSVSGFGQKKQLKKAVKKGKNSNDFYQAEFKKVYKKDKIKSWCSNNGYVLLGYTEGKIARFGGYETGIDGARFMTKRDYAAMVEKERERQAQLAEARRNSRSNQGWSSAAKVAAGAAVLYGLFKGTKWVAGKALENIADSNSYSSSSSSSSNPQIEKYSEWKKTSIFGSDTEHCDNCYKRKVYFKCSSSGYTYSSWYVRNSKGYKSGTLVATDENGLFSNHTYDSEYDCVNAIIQWQCSNQ